MDDNSPVTALSRALLGAECVLIALLVPTRDLGPLVWGPALLALWLCTASLISYFGMRLRQSEGAVARRRYIPLRFSGPTGRFALRSRGDGRKVEVSAGPQLVAEVIASDPHDEIVLHAEAVPDEELRDLGSAIGQAIKMAAAAAEDIADTWLSRDRQRVENEYRYGQRGKGDRQD
jgi:hypothetical protein